MGQRFNRFSALIQKEMIQLLRDRRTLTIILAIPLIELFLFAYAVDLTVDHIPMAVADMSLDRQSQAFIDALVVSGFFDAVLYVANEEEVVQAIDEGRVRAGLVIPPDFAAQVERGQAQALILLDGSDSFTVQSGYSAAAAVTQAHAIQLVEQKVNRMGLNLGPFPINSATRVLYNPALDDMIFIVPATAAMLLQIMAINLTAYAVVREREMGTIEQLLSTPARPMELMVGKMAPNIIVSAFGLLTISLIGVYWFGVPFRGNPWLFAWLALLFLISGLGLGLLVSTMAQTQKQSQQITMLLLLLSLLLTGFIYPRAPMPPIIQFIGNLIPLTYFIRITRGIFTKGVDLAFLWPDVVALIIYGAVVMGLAAATFKKRLD
jgi:ABC-2 type transport system permease protein